MVRTRRSITLSLSLLVLSVLSVGVAAQTAAPSPPANPAPVVNVGDQSSDINQDATTLAKKLQNPIGGIPPLSQRRLDILVGSNPAVRAGRLGYRRIAWIPDHQARNAHGRAVQGAAIRRLDMNYGPESESDIWWCP